jgi:FkbM family methyltransferase
LVVLPSFVKARIGRGLYRVVMGARAVVGDREPEVLCTRSGIHWQLDLREAVELAIYVFGAFEPELRRLLERVLGPGMVAIDIGANVGSHALYMGRLVGPAGRVYALEPTEYAFQKLVRNLELNPWTDGVLHAKQAFVGDHETPAPEAVYSSWDLERLARGHKDHGGHLKSAAGAESITIDAFVRQQGIERVDVIKIDVDGFEMRVVRGALDTLERLRPHLVLELCEYTLAETGSSVRELTGALSALGYTFRTTRMRDLPSDPEAMARFVPRRGIVNVLAVPPCGAPHAPIEASVEQARASADGS